MHGLRRKLITILALSLGGTVAWGHLTPSRYDFLLRQTIDTKPETKNGQEIPTLGTIMGAAGGGSAEVRGTLTACKMADEENSSLWRLSVDEAQGKADLYAVFSPDGRAMTLFRGRKSNDVAFGHAKQLTSALQHPSPEQLGKSPLTVNFPSPLGMLDLEFTRSDRTLKFHLKSVEENPEKLHTEKLVGEQIFLEDGTLQTVRESIDWHQGQLRGTLQVEFNRTGAVTDCPKLKNKLALPLVNLGLDPVQWELKWDKETPLKELHNRHQAYLSNLSIKELLAPTGIPDKDAQNARLALQVLQSKKSKPRNEATAEKLFEEAVKRGEAKEVLRIGGVLAQFGSPRAQRAIAKAAGAKNLTAESAEQLVRLLFFPEKGDVKAVRTLLPLSEDTKRPITFRDATILVASSLAAATKDKSFLKRMERYLDKQRRLAQKKTNDPMVMSYQNALDNLKNNQNQRD